MTKISDLKQQWMDDPAFCTAYEEADADYRVVEALIRARERAGLARAALHPRVAAVRSGRSLLRPATSASPVDPTKPVDARGWKPPGMA